ncbi:class I SAM-dependent methyltransferase [Chloroflexota bacterium]
MPEKQLFDSWPDRYNDWFTTPIGKLVLETESELVMKFVNPAPGEAILDAGCGTGIFTTDFLTDGALVTGLDISHQMLVGANRKIGDYPFSAVQADMVFLPFKDNSFDKSVSITALEFIEDARTAVNELFRVTRPGGSVVVATLNSLSPWAVRRGDKTIKGEGHILENAFYRSPGDLLSLSPLKGETGTAVHFLNDDDPSEAVKIEHQGRTEKLDSGALVAVRWIKPL